MCGDRCLKMAVRKFRKFKEFQLTPAEKERGDDVYSETMKRAVMEMLDEGFELKRERSVLSQFEGLSSDWNKIAFAVSKIQGVYVTKAGEVIIRAERFSPAVGEAVKEIWTLVPGPATQDAEKEAEA